MTDDSCPTCRCPDRSMGCSKHNTRLNHLGENQDLLAPVPLPGSLLFACAQCHQARHIDLAIYGWAGGRLAIVCRPCYDGVPV